VKGLALTGLALTLVGALALAWLDLTAKPRTWSSLTAEPAQRKWAAWVGFPLIAAGTALQFVAVAAGGE
jgi:hypothetical protein